MTWFILLSLLIIGLLLVLTEILFVPGTTLVGIIGVFFTAGSIYFAFLKFDNQTAWIIAIFAIVINFIAIFYGFRSGVWSKFALKDTISHHAFEERLEGLGVGMEGKAISDIKPIGKAEIGDKIYEVKSDVGLIRAGTKIYIHKLENNKIIIKA